MVLLPLSYSTTVPFLLTKHCDLVLSGTFEKKKHWIKLARLFRGQILMFLKVKALRPERGQAKSRKKKPSAHWCKRLWSHWRDLFGGIKWSKSPMFTISPSYFLLSFSLKRRWLIFITEKKVSPHIYIAHHRAQSPVFLSTVQGDSVLKEQIDLALESEMVNSGSSSAIF